MAPALCNAVVNFVDVSRRAALSTSYNAARVDVYPVLKGENV